MYDEVMRHIEPDLMLTATAGLDEKYKGETPEFHQARMDDYEKAFAAFDLLSADIEQMFLREVKKLKQQAEKVSHAREVAESEKAVEEISARIDDSDDTP